LLAGPPLLCLSWYLGWRSWYPDMARLVGRRRSRACRLALKSLRGLTRKLAPKETAVRVTAIVSKYLQERLDLAAAEPTPADVSALLQSGGVASSLALQFAGLLRICDAVRFAPQPPSSEKLAVEAARLIRELEAEPCLAATS
jgi:hypothetical protein